MAESSLAEAFHTLQRVVLGVLIAFLGMTGYGVATDAFAESQYVIALAAAVGSLVVGALVVALFVEGWREGRPA
jgi:uncharacterized membrane protein YjjB (DUF3815 family)